MNSSLTFFPSLRSHLRIAYGSAIFLAFCLFLSPRAQADQTPVVPPQLLEWKQEVERAQTSLSSQYGYKPAPKTLLAAFEEGGVMWAKRYKSSWGGWIFTDWDVAQGLHKRTLRNLKDAINLHKSGDNIPVDHWSQLTTMMKEFRSNHATYIKLFEKRIDYNVKQALELDFKHDHEIAKAAAVAVEAKVLAEFHQSMIEHYAAEAEKWRKKGLEASDQIRKIGYGKTSVASR